MKIKSIRIQNFRSFQDETVYLNRYSCFVGPNGAGKSSVLAALNVFFREKSGAPTDINKLTDEDYFNKNTDSPVRITVRYVRYLIDIPGFRTRHIRVVTTLLEAPAKELAQLYLRRWDIELCFDDIKTTMGMDFIRAKSPAMAVKMVTIYAIAYNLVRLLMQQAARATGCHTSAGHSMRLSFKGALDATLRFAAEMAQASRKQWHSLRHKLLRTIAGDCLPRRLDRFEPRVVKRRPKPFSRMTVPRAVLKQRILANHARFQAST